MAGKERPARKLANGNAYHGDKEPALEDGANITTEKTDYSRWRLLDERGRQTWHYLDGDEELKTWPQSTADKYHIGLPTVTWTLS